MWHKFANAPAVLQICANGTPQVENTCYQLRHKSKRLAPHGAAWAVTNCHYP